MYEPKEGIFFSFFSVRSDFALCNSHCIVDELILDEFLAGDF